MIVAMDLNVSPVPEEDEDTFDRHIEEYSAPEHEERVESAVDITRWEREERRRRLKRDRIDDRPMQMSQPPFYDQFQAKTQKTYDKSRLPPGWLDCPPAGNEICCMIPSKVPLGESYDCILPGKRYSFKQVIHQQRVLGRKLGLVIDLTNTSGYYQTTDLTKEGTKHVKIQCMGRGSVPDNPSVNQFVYEVSQFLLRQKHSKKYILVHCTHGYNRTGYMIIHYLMRSQISMSVTQAISIFAEARPPGIYKLDYIEALYAFYHERKPENVLCPPMPEWERSEFDLNGEAVTDDDDDGGSAAPVHTRGNSQFPGSHPVSLNRDNLQLLRQRCYYATWKADGTRYMMLITIDGCYLIDRSFNFRRVQMRIPCKPTSDVHFALF